MKTALLIFLFSIQASAFFERGLSAAAGSNPAGANMSADLSYNYKVWGGEAPTNGEAFWKYGYLRPKLAYTSSFYINTFDAELQIYPIAIFGGTIGSSYAERAVKRLDLFDCDLVNCKGKTNKSYYKVNLNLGYGDWMGALIYGKDYIKGTDKNAGATAALVEYDSMLLIPFEQDVELEKMVGFIGYKLLEPLTVALYETHYKIEDKKSEGQYFVVNLKSDEFSSTLGLGAFGSDYNEKTFAAFVKVSWLLDPTLSLND